ncbi:MAG TPA: hypothetical protein VMV41_01205 [Cellulomonadaceae bacterium]|nr:hypothetical protein [Cellulomonadaceae bacterium]
MSTELTVHQSESGLTLQDKMQYAKALATASLLPKAYQNNPGNLLFALEYAEALGVAPINAITSIHVIDGKPSASADLIAGLVRRAGHRLRVEGDDTYAVAQLIRADDPDYTYEARWDLDKARTAGLLGKGTWKNYPGALLRSRAITEVARMGASDALFGVIYTPEELGAEVDAEGEIVETRRATRPVAASGRDRLRAALAPTAPVNVTDLPVIEIVETVQDGEIVYDVAEPEPEPLRTEAQSKRLFAMLNEAGLTERDHVLAWLTELLGRDVDSTKTLTKTECTKAMDALEASPADGAA